MISKQINSYLAYQLRRRSLQEDTKKIKSEPLPLGRVQKILRDKGGREVLLHSSLNRVRSAHERRKARNQTNL